MLLSFVMCFYVIQQAKNGAIPVSNQIWLKGDQLAY